MKPIKMLNRKLAFSYCRCHFGKRCGIIEICNGNTLGVLNHQQMLTDTEAGNV
jgi:hypothetical protein